VLFHVVPLYFSAGLAVLYRYACSLVPAVLELEMF